MKKIFLLILLGLSIQGQSQSKTQKTIWSTKNAYLGQKPPGDIPEPFAPGLLFLNDSFPFDRVAFSADGTEFYYPSNTTWFSSKGERIRYFKFDGKKWNGPFPLFDGYYAPAFSPDDQTLYMAKSERDSVYAKVWQSHRTPEGGWTQPEIYIKKQYGLYDFMPTRSGTCYVGSNALQGKLRDFSTYDFCALSMTPADTIIRSLGSPLNTAGFEGDFYIAPDESYMIVSIHETKDFECELYCSFHQPDGSWSTPLSLGPNINNGIAHRWGQYVSPDGKYLFYSTGHSPQDCKIFWVRFDTLLASLRHKWQQSPTFTK